eukprot:TRINITY_DN359_c0_g1_i1.p1 TRINITY_DN359_c0_g1~~TRINITY_DN359_c0_g1_i1.p1  ORF type:complete len:128 (+),score=25.09 TRINITY_DN359_c0_g1_i1:108-491(+)
MSSQSQSFKSMTPFEKRREVADKIKSRYPERIPVIVERAPKTDVPEIDKKKYLVPSDITISKFLFEIRKHIKLSSEKALYLFVSNNIYPPTSALVSSVYEKYKDPDGFLYFTYSGENTFGAEEEADC